MPLVAFQKAATSGPVSGPRDDDNERRLTQIALRGLRDLKSNASLDRIEAGLRAGGVSALNSFDFTVLISSMASARPVLANAISGEATAQALALGFNMRFDKVDPNVVRQAELITGRMIKGITDTTREAIRRVVTLGIATQSLTVKDMARVIRTSTGLTPRSTVALRNTYETTLNDALNAGLSREAAEARAQKLADKVADRALRQRAEMIARTEVMTASNAGRMVTWKSANKQGLIREGTTKEWIATISDKRTCDICGPLDGQRVPWNAPFPGIGDMPPAHPSCRCTAVLVSPKRVKRDPEQELAPPPEVIEAEPPKDVTPPKPAPTAPLAPRKFGSEADVAEFDARHGKPWVDSLTGDERDFVRGYSANAFRDVNPALRRNEVDTYQPQHMHMPVRDYVQKLDSAMAKAELAEPIVVYRGCNFTDKLNLKAGDEFTDHAYVSTSMLSGKAYNEYGKKMVITVPAGTRGASLRSISHFEGENEFLLDSGTSYRIDKVEGDLVYATVTGQAKSGSALSRRAVTKPAATPATPAAAPTFSTAPKGYKPKKGHVVHGVDTDGVPVTGEVKDVSGGWSNIIGQDGKVHTIAPGSISHADLPATPAPTKPAASLAPKAFTHAQAKEFDEQFGKPWLKALPGPQRAAVKAYTGETFAHMNKKLRKGDGASATALKLHEALKSSVLKETVVVHRGCEFTSKLGLKPGMTFTDNGFVSTSLVKFPKQYAFAEGAKQLSITVPAGFRGGSVQGISKFENERELVLDAGTTFRVDKVTANVIHVTVIRQADELPVAKATDSPDDEKIRQDRFTWTDDDIEVHSAE